MKNIIIIVTFILFIALVAQAWCEGIDKLKGKKSQPGVNCNHEMTIINPLDVNGQPVNLNFDWKKNRGLFRRVK
jgi:hypothetical protein